MHLPNRLYWSCFYVVRVKFIFLGFHQGPGPSGHQPVLWSKHRGRLPSVEVHARLSIHLIPETNHFRVCYLLFFYINKLLHLRKSINIKCVHWFISPTPSGGWIYFSDRSYMFIFRHSHSYGCGIIFHLVMYIYIIAHNASKRRAKQIDIQQGQGPPVGS